MTTTLRPAGQQEQPAGAGHGSARRRVYDICDNGRRVGTVRLSAADERGVLTGRITGLRVDEADRRRGRATVAALAAEEVLRGWGCARLFAAVPVTAEPALRLAAALGYTERSRCLLKGLPGPGPETAGLPAGSRLTPLTGDAYEAWLSRDRVRYAADLAVDGVPADRAEAEAARDQHALLPGGPDTPGMELRTLRHEGAAVGTLWLRIDGAPHPDADAWVFGVEVAEQHRGRGHGRTLMRAAEQVCREAERRVLGLRVHAGNVPARSLYESLGYCVAEYRLGKRLL